MKRVHVVWLDITTIDAWTPRSELEEDGPTRCESYGFLSVEKPGFIVVSGTANSLDHSDPDFCASIAIPRGVILSITELPPLPDDGEN